MKAKATARFRMRITSGDAIAVGPGKIALLEAIRETRSITAAAKSIDMSYRRAWILVDELNTTLKKPAVTSSKGGDHGRGQRAHGRRRIAAGLVPAHRGACRRGLRCRHPRHAQAGEVASPRPRRARAARARPVVR